MHQVAARSWCELQLAAPVFVCPLPCLYVSIYKHGPGQLLQLQLFGPPNYCSCSYSGLELAGLELAGLVAVDLELAGLVAVDLELAGLVAVDLVAVDLVAVDLVAADLVAVALVPWSAVRGPWRVSECPPTRGPKNGPGRWLRWL